MKRFTVAAVMFAMMSGGFVFAQDPKLVEAGKKVFDAQKCIMCHQVAGKGNKMYPLDGVAAKMSEADVRKWLTAPAEMEAKLAQQPKLKMSSRKYNLKPADIDALVAYLKSLK